MDTHEQRIKKIFSDYDKIGEVVEGVAGPHVGFYRYAHYQDPSTKDNLPDFLKEAIGPPLRNLDSFGFSGDEVIPSKGLGRFVDITHNEMRNLGRRIAGYVFGRDAKPFTAEGTLQEHIQQLPQQITLRNGCIIDKSLAKEILMLGAIAQKFKRRKGGEEDLLNDNIGNALEVYNTMGSIIDKLQVAAERQGVAFPKETLLSISPIKQAFLEERQHLQDARVFIYAAKDGIMPDALQMLLNLPDDRAIAIETPKDAASAVFSLAYFRRKKSIDHTTQSPVDPNIPIDQQALAVSQKIAEAKDNQEARAILNSDECKALIETAKKAGPDDGRYNSKKAIIEALERYQSPAIDTPAAGVGGGWAQKNTPQQRAGHGSEISL